MEEEEEYEERRTEPDDSDDPTEQIMEQKAAWLKCQTDIVTDFNVELAQSPVLKMSLNHRPENYFAEKIHMNMWL